MPYIAVSGNSGAGKSTMLGRLGDMLCAKGRQVVIFDEREFHHPHLLRMFEAPKNWALPVQMNFIVQRATALMRAFEEFPLATVVMERSLSEDALFMSLYHEQGFIEDGVMDSYLHVLTALERRTPAPDLHVYLTAPTDILIGRIEQDVRDGRRPPEISGQELRKYIEAVERKYRGWLAESRRGGACVIQASTPGDTRQDPALELVWQAVLGLEGR